MCGGVVTVSARNSAQTGMNIQCGSAALNHGEEECRPWGKRTQVRNRF